ncbi:alpha-amylase [Orenia metallireducens]|uniref:Alpha-amylase n=1 Tax=Orenia metallireducens TaxID=1413210 RepID=A0A1C0A8B1_9FIRM|nr:alpha-amylase family glycosyl hydrolase [Orenia metallireducens]OCL26499.1 alpha-amylase [Orenia metallireducens]
MAFDTPIELRNQIIYEAYVRNHSKEGTFNELVKDLDNIKELGVDILWLMPIHPIGQKNKKGELGCPYSIQDYKGVNPEYGTLDDFKGLIKAVHQRGMKLMIDVVYNHTAHDSKLFKEHPEWFYQTADGEVGNKVGDWYDVIDLDFDNLALWNYLIDALKYWVELGVDGFRCDVASMIPLKFWKRARKEVAQVREGIIWIAESVEPDFLKALRKNGFVGLSDAELYQAFDVSYDYDTFLYFKKYKSGKISFAEYLEKVRMQEYIYPANYVKMRFIENHDQERARRWLPVKEDLYNWTAFYYFQQGLTLIYGGQETDDIISPSLFDHDPVDWTLLDEYYVDLLKDLGEIKKDEIFAKGYYEILDSNREGVVVATYQLDNRLMVGIFNLEQKLGDISVPVSDGKYENLISAKTIKVEDGKVTLSVEPIIFAVEVEDNEKKVILSEL